MDPLTAIGLASNVAQLVELSWKIVSKSHEIYKHGALPEHRDTTIVTTDLKTVNDKLLEFLHRSEKEQNLSEDDEALRRLCEASNKIAGSLIDRLETIKPGDEYRSWKSIRSALKSVWIKSELDETAARLQNYRTQLNTRILVSIRDRIDQLDQNTQIINASLSDNRILYQSNQEIQTQYLTRLISSQHDRTRELLTNLVRVDKPLSALTLAADSHTGQLAEKQDPRTAILPAVSEQNLAKLRRAIRADPSCIFARNAKGQSALHLAANAGNPDLMAYLIRNGAQINPDDDEGMVPLHFAVQSRSEAVTRLLVAKGADTTAKDANGRTPGDLCPPSSLIGWILEHGARLETRNHERLTALYYFVMQGELAAVRTLLDQKADVDTSGRFDRTPLFEATEIGHVEIVALLLERGADVHKLDDRRGTALCLAGIHGRTRVGELLLEHNADIDAENEHGYSALTECCTHGHIEMGLMLIQRGAQLENFNESGYAPLHFASGAGNHGSAILVKAILERGSNIDIINSENDWTALAEACAHGYLDIVELLLSRGAATETPIAEVGATALMLAAEKGCTQIVERLLDHAAVNIEASDIGGRTALFFAVHESHTGTVRALLRHDANVEVRDALKYTPLCRACQNCHREIVELLLHAGANVHSANEQAWAPLHEASWRGDYAIVNLLLEHGASPTYQNHLRYTPIHLAAQGPYPEVVRLLLENDLSGIALTNRDDWTPLAEASHHGQLEVARVLLAYGANPDTRDNFRYTSLNRAAQGGHTSIVILLLDEGKADINAVQREGWCSLAEAGWHGHEDVVIALLDRGARTDICNRNGHSPRDLARIHNHRSIVSLLS